MVDLTDALEYKFGQLGVFMREVPEHGIGGQVLIQVKAVGVTVVWSGVVSVIAFLIAKALTGGGRVSEDEENTGLDLTYHGEGAYGSDS